MGMTLAFFRLSGNTPSKRDLLMIVVRGGIKNVENSLRRLDGILKGPEDLEVDSLAIKSPISSSLQGSMVIWLLDFWPRKSRKFFLDSGIFLSISVPTLT